MSHYTKVEAEFQEKNDKDLVAALRTVFGESNIEVHDKPQILKMYHGGNSNEAPCEIIIRRENLEKKLGRVALTNDLGFRKNNGKFEIVADRAGFPTDLENEIKQEYTVKVAERKLKLQGYVLKRERLKDGKVKLTATRYSK